MSFFTKFNNALTAFADFTLDIAEPLPLHDDDSAEVLRFDAAPGEDAAIRDALEADMKLVHAQEIGADAFDLFLTH